MLVAQLTLWWSFDICTHWHDLVFKCWEYSSDSEPEFYYRHFIPGLLIPDIYTHNRVLPFFRCQTWAGQIDSIAATGLVILLKLDSTRRLFSPCDLEIWFMTSKNNRTPLPYCVKLCTSYQSHRWIQTWVTVRKRSILAKLAILLPCDIEIIWMILENSKATLLYHAQLVHYFKAIGEFKLELQSGNAQFLSKTFFCPVWTWDLTDDR